MDIEAIFGSLRKGLKGRGTVGATPEGAMHVADVHGRYFTLAREGKIFTVTNASYTIAAAAASPIAAGTGIPILMIRNDDKNALIKIIRMQAWTISGTPAGPFLVNGWNDNSAMSVASNITPLNGNGFAAGPGSARVIGGTAQTAGLAGTLCGVLGGPAAVAAGAGHYVAETIPDGQWVLPEKAAIAIAATGTGTSHVVGASITFAMIDTLPP